MSDDIEQRIRASLTARAALVTEENSAMPAAPGEPARQKRWPILVAAASVVLVAAGIATISSIDSAGREPAPVLPGASSTTVATTPPSTASATTTVPSISSTAATASVDTPPTCAGKPCVLMQSVPVAGEVLEVWAATSTVYPGSFDRWVVRVRGGAVLSVGKYQDNFVTKNGLSCTVLRGKPVCLLDLHYLGDSDHALGLVKDGSGWRFTGASFGTPWGADLVWVTDARGPLRVIAAEQRSQALASHPNEEKPYYSTKVFTWEGDLLGCTVPVTTKPAGWPRVDPDPSTLDKTVCI